MLTKAISASLLGIDAHPVEVEVDISSVGLPQFSVVGLPDAAVKESRDRVRSAMKNVGYEFPMKPVTVNLAPANLRKEGSAFDLPMAVGLVASQGIIGPGATAGYMFTGELSLDGRIKPVRGALSMALLARRLRLKLVLPMDNAHEAAVVEGAVIVGAETLPEVVDILRGRSEPRPMPHAASSLIAAYEADFSEVKGQEHAKRALEVAAAGGHNVLMIGPPGAGKTMLARRLPSVMPEISFEEAIETTRIYSVAGMLKSDEPLIGTRPFRSPHHTISDAALIGGGQTPRPGEVSLAHNGVLFLDELPEFKRTVLEVLRQPLEDQEVTISRTQASITYPASFMLVAAMNPCPCGYFGDTRRQCTCSPFTVSRYRARVSGPLMDRIDIHIEVPSVVYRDMVSIEDSERSEAIRNRVGQARELQYKRFKGDRIYCNSQMSNRHMKRHCRADDDARGLLERAMKGLSLSARAYARILKLSRTIADMDGADVIGARHISEAIQYRTLDRQA